MIRSDRQTRTSTDTNVYPRANAATHARWRMYACYKCSWMRVNRGYANHMKITTQFIFLLLYAKFSIYKCKLQRTLTSFATFLHELDFIHFLEELAYQKNNTNRYPYKGKCITLYSFFTYTCYFLSINTTIDTFKHESTSVTRIKLSERATFRIDRNGDERMSLCSAFPSFFNECLCFLCVLL